MARAGPGSPEPLGLAVADGGANVAVFSAHATAIELCLFDANGEREIGRVALPSRTGDVFHGFVAGVAPGARYGLRAHGPWAPGAGHRFNPAKLLVDPYATALDRRFAWDPVLRGTAEDGARRDPRDSAALVPKCIAAPAAAPAATVRPRVAWADTVLYELHVRGFTMRHPEVPPAIRGTFAGLAHPAAIGHLMRLGVTTVELMPVAAVVDERHLRALGLTNYWGYNPVAHFVPDPRLAPGGIDEVRRCVDALHAAGIEAILDVVLNHTGEGDAEGPTLSLRGLDNAAYYRLDAGDPARYVNDTGCGNTLALDRPPALRLALDVLRHYAQAVGFDGFRFDLATTLGRRADGFDSAAPLLQAIAQDPVLRELKLVAEPWDLGPGGYRLGAFPAPWGEWNDRYRDGARRFWRGDGGLAGELATRLAGSADVFAGRRRPLSRSVNFVAAHDGFTLADLTAHAAKHNEANGEANRDGTDANFSWNHGIEGATLDARVAAARARDVRGLLATLLVSRGTPMLAMGDELGRSQRGNNNAYAQDNALAWIDWASADDGLVELVAALVALRRAHPALKDERPLDGAGVDATGIPDVEWRRPDGAPMTGADWTRPDAHALVAAFYAPATEAAAADRVAVALNAGPESVRVRWPDPRKGFAWRRVVDTAVASPAPEGGLEADASDDPVAARGVVVVVEAPSTAPRRRGSGAEPAALDRLAAAAGIAPEWWEVSGERHEVGPDTKRALLAAIGLGVETTDDARARLVELALRRERRRLPATVLASEGRRAVVPIAAQDGSALAGRALGLTREDGTRETLALDLDSLPTRTIGAADARAVAQRLLTLPELPPGVHALSIEGRDDESCAILVAPERAYLPEALAAGGRSFGLAAHLYALRRSGDGGIGDFTTLAIAGAATARAGGAIVAINPLHALFAGERERASPYHPSDRRFLDPIYVDVERVPEFAASHRAQAALAAHRGARAAPSSRAEVDYDAAWRAKRAVLDACHAAFEQRPRDDPRVADYERFCAEQGDALRDFAIFEAISAAHPRVPWPRWPAGLRRPDAAGVRAFAADRAREVRFACYLQWLADRQLAEAVRDARGAGLDLGILRDLAVGAAPDGAEAWAGHGLYARGASVGAPPDPFARAGQNWNLPPPIPDALLEGGCAAFRRLLAANMRHAGALRIDHAMGLARLFWIPDGAAAADGAYVGYPLDALLGALALESRRARCLVVGEDLGTVPEGFRDRLAAADVLSYRVVWLEREGRGFVDPARFPAKSVACVTTHDLPTIAGWWSGADIAERHALGFAEAGDAARLVRERADERRSLCEVIGRAAVAPDPDGPCNAPVAAAIHGFACASPAALVLIQADDLAGETAAPNLPGTDRERPNWRRRVGVAADALWRTPAGERTLAACAARRRDPASG